MSKTYRIEVFGKTGCDKCAVLNQRLDKALATETWKDFEKQYHDVETEEGLVAFCEAECINPQRIPAFLVSRQNSASGEYEPLPNRQPGGSDPVCKQSRLHTWLGLQTDYSDEGRGLITPAMIASVLADAIAQ